MKERKWVWIFFSFFIFIISSGSLIKSKSLAAEEMCPKLPMEGNFVHVSTTTALINAVNSDSEGDTILIADGTYHLNGGYLRFNTPHVTLRSASGNRGAVILDGNYDSNEIIQIVASHVTIADVTLREAYYHPIHIMSTEAHHTNHTRIYNVHVIDPGEQAIKINPVPGAYYTDYGMVACSRIQLTATGRSYIRNNCYTGGIDAHKSLGWVIRDNRIEGFWCESGLSEHGIHFWRGCRDTLVERNTLRNNARGIGFGLGADGSARTYDGSGCADDKTGYVEHFDGIIRNNFIFASNANLFDSQYGFDTGIGLWHACGGKVLHNTVASTRAPFSSIEWRFDNTNVEIINNLVTHNLRDRGGTAQLSGNLTNQPLSMFEDGSSGNLHLAETAIAAIDQGVVLSGLCDDDIDGDARPYGEGMDIGSDEFIGLTPASPRNLKIKAYRW